MNNIHNFDRNFFEETEILETDIRNCFNIVSKQIFHTSIIKNLCVTLYGSPGRVEMVGGNSDADILLIYEKWTNDISNFREIFIQRLYKTKRYSKIDLPNFGSIEDCKIYLSKSIVEANQIIESRFIIGDYNIWKKLVKIKYSYNNILNITKKIIFNNIFIPLNTLGINCLSSFRSSFCTIKS